MKKISFKMPAFSLAEALITLLIVCLITLASIPILTKKKRTANNGAHGTWMCTWNSERKLVHWSSSEPKGDVNKPDTWAEGCNFVPPVNASVFNITAIGAGGTGGPGETALDLKADGQNVSTYKPEADGLYRVLVAGGGGGGGGGIWRSDSTGTYNKYNCDGGSCGTGGAGASGAYVVADVKLYKDAEYYLAKGRGGGPKECIFHKSTQPPNERGADGGASKFYRKNAVGHIDYDSSGGLYVDLSKNSTSMIAAGGQGGERIGVSGQGCCKDHCRYGAPGLGKADYVGADANILAKSAGISGQSGGCAVVYSHSGDGSRIGNLGIWGSSSDSIGDANGGAGFDARTYLIPYSGIGYGGFGSRPKFPKQDGVVADCYTAGTGGDGAVLVYRIKRMQGYGGKAAKPEEKLSMTIKGKIDIQVGNTYGKDVELVKTNGSFDPEKYHELRTTRVTIYDKQNRETKRIVGYPGEDGGNFEGTSAQDGFASYWTEKGGGKASTNADCEATQKPLKENEYENTYPVCKKTACESFVDGDDAERNDIDGYKYGTGTQGTKTVLQIIGSIPTTSLAATNEEFKGYLDKMSYDYFREMFGDTYTNSTTGQTTKVVKYNDVLAKEDGKFKYFINNNDELKFYYNYDKTVNGYPKLNEDSGMCYDDGKLRYRKICVDEPNSETGETNKVKITTGGKQIGVIDTFVCKSAKSADRRAFGAGGGGGYAHEHPGVTSAGGLGAPGAVIIEW